MKCTMESVLHVWFALLSGHKALTQSFKFVVRLASLISNLQHQSLLVCRTSRWIWGIETCPNPLHIEETKLVFYFLTTHQKQQNQLRHTHNTGAKNMYNRGRISTSHGWTAGDASDNCLQSWFFPSPVASEAITTSSDFTGVVIRSTSRICRCPV
jgi:hypothetical protein